jgi:PPIC-type PPIASE domain
MRKYCVLPLFFALFAWGQVKPAPAPVRPSNRLPEPDDEYDSDETPPPVITLSAVPENAAVLTIKGFCPKSQATAAQACKTVVTRAEFERVMATIHPGTVAPELKHQLSISYPRLMVMSQQAEKRGLDRTPSFADKLRFARMQILSQELVRDFEKQSAKVSDAEIETYYQANSVQFEQASLERVFIPRMAQPKPGESVTVESQEASQASLSTLSQQLHERAVDGESFSQLQRQAYEAAGIKGDAPGPDLSKARLKSLPPAHAAVFQLKTGEISQVFSDPSGHYFYRVNAITAKSLAEVREEIRRTLQADHMRKLMAGIDKSFSSEVNPAYFVDPLAPAPRPARSQGDPAAKSKDAD